MKFCKKNFITILYVCIAIVSFICVFNVIKNQYNSNKNVNQSNSICCVKKLDANLISNSNFTVKSQSKTKLKISFLLDITDDLSQEVETQIGDLEDDKFDEILKNLGDREKQIFQNEGFFEKIKKIISGQASYDFVDLINIVLSLFLDNFSGIIPILAIICAVAIMSSLLLQLRGKALNKPLGDIIHFCTFAVIIVSVLTSVLELVKLTSNTLSLLKSQMEICFPILLTLMAGLGAGTSVGIYQPMIAILSGAVMHLFTSVLLPIFSLCIIFSVIGNLTSSVKLTKFTKFLESSFKYIIGFTFTIFSAFLAVSGIVAGSFDGISIRATKFAVKSYIPFVGGYLADGFSLIMTSSILIKNAIGYSGLIVMFLTVISPLLKIVLFKLGLSLVAGVIESVADSRVTNFVSATAKSLSMLSGIILAFSFAYMISVGLIMCSSNLI